MSENRGGLLINSVSFFQTRYCIAKTGQMTLGQTNDAGCRSGSLRASPTSDDVIMTRKGGNMNHNSKGGPLWDRCEEKSGCLSDILLCWGEGLCATDRNEPREVSHGLSEATHLNVRTGVQQLFRLNKTNKQRRGCATMLSLQRAGYDSAGQQLDQGPVVPVRS
ncbi:hypothetical protein BKA93DRAFT_521434 [Sparassis latifolia]